MRWNIKSRYFHFRTFKLDFIAMSSGIACGTSL